MDKIDNLDRTILNLLMKNARVPSKEIAEVCGVSRAAIYQRVAKLVESGVITGSNYQVDPCKLGYHTTTYIGVSLRKGSMYHNVVKELENIPEVVECHYTTGPYTMFIKVYARDNKHLMMLLNGSIQNIEGVTTTETLICLEKSMSRHIPIFLDEHEAAQKEELRREAEEREAEKREAVKKGLLPPSVLKEKKRPGRKKGSVNKKTTAKKSSATSAGKGVDK